MGFHQWRVCSIPDAVKPYISTGKLVIPVNMLTHVNSIGFNLFYVSLPGCSPRMRFITNSGEPLNTDGCVCCRHSSIHTSIQSSIHQSPPECQSLDSAGWWGAEGLREDPGNGHWRKTMNNLLKTSVDLGFTNFRFIGDFCGYVF